MLIIFFWLGLALAVGAYANGKERSFVGYFALSLILSPLVGFIIAAIAKDDSPPKQVVVVNTAQPAIQHSPSMEIDALEHLAVLREKGVVNEEEFNIEKTKILHGNLPTKQPIIPKSDYKSGRYLAGYSNMPYPVPETVITISSESITVYKNNAHNKADKLAIINRNEIISLEACNCDSLLKKLGASNPIFSKSMTQNIPTNNYIYITLKTGEFLVFENRENNSLTTTTEIQDAYNSFI